jgi:integrase
MADQLFRKSSQKNGWYYGWFYGPDGKRVIKSLKTADRRIAKNRIRHLERQAHAPGGLSANAPSHTVTDAVKYIVEVGCSDKAAGTLHMYSKKGGHLARLIGSTQVSRLTVDDVQNYINQRLAETAAPESVRKELSTLRVALEVAKLRGLFRSDPRAVIPRFTVKYVPRDRHLTVDEFAKLMEVLAPRRRRWVMVGVYTGGRRSELEALRWEEHIDLVSGWAILPGTKTATAWRKVPIPKPLGRALETIAKRSGPVVHGWANVCRDLAVACKRAGVRRVSPNDLRRTYSSWLKQQGEDSAVVAKLLGHTSTKMVDLVYGRLNDGNFTRAAARLPPMASLEIGSASEADAGHLPGPGRLLGNDQTEKIRGVVVPRGGIEPPTRGFSVPCSTN